MIRQRWLCGDAFFSVGQRRPTMFFVEKKRRNRERYFQRTEWMEEKKKWNWEMRSTEFLELVLDIDNLVRWRTDILLIDPWFVLSKPESDVCFSVWKKKTRLAASQLAGPEFWNWKKWTNHTKAELRAERVLLLILIVGDICPRGSSSILDPTAPSSTKRENCWIEQRTVCRQWEVSSSRQKKKEVPEYGVANVQNLVYNRD